MGVKNDRFWSEIGSGFLRTRGHTPTKNSQEYPLPPPGLRPIFQLRFFGFFYSMIAFHTNFIPYVLSCDYSRLLISNRLVHFHK